MKIKRLLKEGEGVDKMRFSVTVMFNTEKTGQMDPHRIEAEIQETLEGIFTGEWEDEVAANLGVDDIVVRREG